MDHAVKTSKTKPWDKLRFENEELECLYQRYTLKMQRFSVIGVVSLFVIFCMTMMTLSYVFSSLLTLHVRTFICIIYIYLVLCSVQFGLIRLRWVKLFFFLSFIFFLYSQRIAIATVDGLTTKER